MSTTPTPTDESAAPPPAPAGGGVLVRAARDRSLAPITDAAKRKAIEAATPVVEEAKVRLMPVAHVAGGAGGLGLLGHGLSQTPGTFGPAVLAAVVAGPVAWHYSRKYVEREYPQPFGPVNPDDPDAVAAAAEALGERDAKVGRVRRFTGWVGAVAGSWTASAAALGVDPSTLGGKINLTMGGLITLWAGSPYVRFRNQPRPAPPAPPREDVIDAEVVEEPPLGWAVEAARLAGVWQERCARERDSVLHGTHLDDATIQEIKGGWSAVIASNVPGQVDPKRFVPATDRIAAAFQVGLADVTVEVLAEDASKAALTLLHDNPLVNFQIWPGPYALVDDNGQQEPIFDVESGVALIGVHADGEHARYRFWNAGGAWHDLISGATGSGKSEFVNLLLALERHAVVEVPLLDDNQQPVIGDDGEPVKVKKGLIISRIGDPQWGQSFGDWQDHVDWFAPTIDEIRTMLQKTEREMYARNKDFGRQKWYDERTRKWRRGVKNWKPTPERPMISVTIDEAHEVLKDAECKRIVALLGKMGRKVGIKLRLITQVPLLQELGNDMAIRDAVASGNVVVFRTANALSGQVAFNGTLPAQPHQLPREWPKGKAKPGQETTAGIGYVLGASSRSAVMRAFYPGDAVDWIYNQEGELFGYPGVLDDLTRAAGVGYEDRHQRLAELDEADGVPESSTTLERTGTCEQAVLEVFMAKASEGYMIKFEDLVKTVVGGFSPRSVTNVLDSWRKKGWLKPKGDVRHGYHQMTQRGIEEAGGELGRDDLGEDPAGDEQRMLTRQ